MMIVGEGGPETLFFTLQMNKDADILFLSLSLISLVWAMNAPLDCLRELVQNDEFQHLTYILYQSQAEIDFLASIWSAVSIYLSLFEFFNFILCISIYLH